MALDLGVLIRQLQGSVTALQGILQALVGKRIAFGIANVVISPAAVGGTLTVTHGLGAAPSHVWATAQASGSGLTCATVNNIGATTFDIGIRFTDGVARALTMPVAWLAFV